METKNANRKTHSENTPAKRPHTPPPLVASNHTAHHGQSSARSERDGARKTSLGTHTPGSARGKKQKCAADPVLVRRRLMVERRSLPIFTAREALLKEIQENTILIVIGETGSGKTTQIPQFLVEAGYTKKGVIGVTQPRRVAAMSIAQRVSEEYGCQLGADVGYTIRFDDTTTPQTKLKYLTDGMLLRELMVDPLLRAYSVVLLDEAHERTVSTEVLFGLLKALHARRPSLKIIIMSATLEAELFSTYFNNAKVVYIAGRQFPVRVMYTREPQPDYLDAAVVTCLQIHLEQPKGDILAFLTGQEEIESLAKIFLEKCRVLPANVDKLLVVTLFAALSPEQQMEAFRPTPSGCRKLILATNIAETSVTINGIVYVVDCGVVKARNFRPKMGVESLQVVPISQAAARQRAGRAGREGPGVAYRLYTEDVFKGLEQSTVPEIKRCSLASTVLQLMVIGVTNVLHFDFMEKPTTIALKKAVEHLYSLGALNNKGELTQLGRDMSGFPVEPTYSKIILMANDFGCLSEILNIISMLSVENIFFTPASKREQVESVKRQFSSQQGDTITLLNVFNAYNTMKHDREWCHEHFINARSLKNVLEVRKQLRSYCLAKGLAVPDVTQALTDETSTAVRRCLTSGLFANAAKLSLDGRCYLTMVGNQEVFVHPSSIMFQKKPPVVIFNELVLTTRTYMRHITAIDGAWLSELAPEFYSRIGTKDASSTSTA